MRNGFYSFESFITPPTIYHYDVVTGQTDIFAWAQRWSFDYSTGERSGR